MKSRWAWALIAACALYGITQFRLDNDITLFVPGHADPEQRAVSRALADSQLAHAMILVVEAPTRERAVSASAQLAERLAELPEVAWIHDGVDRGAEQAFHELFYPARFGLISDRPDEELPELLSNAGLARAARDLKAFLAGPLGSGAVANDPFLAFPRHLRRLQDLQSDAVTIVDGQFVTRDGARGLIFLATRSSPFSSSPQRAFMAELTATFHEIDERQGGELKLLMSGVNRFALSAEAATKADIERVSILSLLGTIALFFAAFRSLRYLVLLVLPLGFGLAAGLAACLALFGSVHGMTLAFGAALIGVCVDYTIHFFNRHVQHAAAEGPAASLDIVWRGILLGAATTITGVAGMMMTGTPGLRQIAVFGCVGVIAAVGATRVVIPGLLPAAVPRASLLGWATRALDRGLRVLASRWRLLLVLPVAASLLIAAWVPRISWTDDPSALATFDASLIEEDTRVRSLLSSGEAGRMVVAMGRDWEQALQRNDRAFLALEQAREAGELAQFTSLHDVLWSKALQARNLDALWRAPQLYERLEAAMVAEGFRPGAFADVGALLNGTPPDPLDIDALREARLMPLIRGLYAETEGGVMIISPLAGVSDAEAIARRLDEYEGVTYFDQAAYLKQAYRSFRTHVLQVVALGLLAVWALVWLRYRRLLPALAAFLPAVLASSSTLALLAAGGVDLNLLNLLGLIMVLSMGVDYAVFVVEAVSSGRGAGEALVGAIISCLTTMLSFGLLAMSSNPALHALGVTVALGCGLSVLLAPVAVIVLRVRT